MAERKGKFKRYLSVLFVLDQLEEIKDRASKRGKTRQWIRRRQENGYFTNIVRELAAEDTPAYHQVMRMKFFTLHILWFAVRIAFVSSTN